jgi:hypothetical protein
MGYRQQGNDSPQPPHSQGQQDVHAGRAPHGYGTPPPASPPRDPLSADPCGSVNEVVFSADGHPANSRPARRHGPYRQHQHRHDHRRPVTPPRPQAGRKKDMRPPARTAPRPPQPELLPAMRHRYHPAARMPPRAEHPAARTPQRPGQQARLDTVSRTPYRHHQVPPPAPPGGLSRSTAKRSWGGPLPFAYMATVTPSIPPRPANPPNHLNRHR